MTMKRLKRYASSLLLSILGLFTATGAQGANSMAPYVSVPLFMSNAVPPNILIIFDNSASMNQMCYWEETLNHDESTGWYEYDIVPTTPYDPSRNYYGYFVAGTPGHRVMYTYGSNKFQRNTTGEWEGNFLNWLCMRRVDVARKVLVGGRATSRTGGGNTTLIGQDPADSNRSYMCKLSGSTMSGYTPHNDGANRYVGVKNGYLYVSKDLNTSPFDKYDYQYKIEVQRDSTYADEANDFLDGNIAGVMQKVGDKAHWGLEFLLDGDGKGQNGGYINSRVGVPTITNLYTNIENESIRTWSPLAEAYYVAVQYFKQQPIDPAFSADYKPSYSINSQWDPYNQNGASDYCARSFVLLFTDGAPSRDGLIPDTYKNYDGDANNFSYPDGGTDDLDDIALWARINDLRPDLQDPQNLELFVVYAFGNDPDARRLLKDAARNGGFVDQNGNNRPDPVSGTGGVATVTYDSGALPDATDNSWSEWWADRRTGLVDHAALPDTYFEAQDGWLLERELINAITKILERAGAGTAVSVLATSGEGEGALYQAYFKPKHTTATEEVYWIGYLQSLWLDAMGNLREDWSGTGTATPDGVLSLSTDPIVTFFFDDSTGETKFNRRTVSAGDLYGVSSTPTTHLMTELTPLWEAGGKLAARNLSSLPRTIYTFVDLNNDGAVGSGEFISFDTTNSAKLKAYLDLADDPATTPVDFAYLGATETDRVQNLINYIRGSDTGLAGTTNVRNRTVGGKVWRLGDIVYSTPTPVGEPIENFDLIYGDASYADFYKLHKDRETMVYVGANDGMFHAFLAGTFHQGAVNTGDGASFTVDGGKYGTLGPGDEIWAYIPEALLPHLKWLADPSYINANHVYYVDLKPRVLDARIYEGADDPGHPLNSLWAGMGATQQEKRPGGWCTLLVGGMRLGGGSITVTGNFDNDGTTPNTTRTFASSYFVLDVTDPKNPILLWERSYPNLGFTTSFPAVVKVDQKSINTAASPATVSTQGRHWYLLFGSGPTLNHYDGTSTQTGRVFLVDLATGRLDLLSNPGRVFTKLTNTDGSDGATSLPANGFMGSPIAVDVGLDYSVDVAYIGETHSQWDPVTLSTTWDGGMYRIKVPVTTDTTTEQPVLLYDVSPDHWTLTQMFDANYAVTAAPAAAVGTVDSRWSLWIYFGTGRLLSNADKTDTTQNYLYGVKDPYFNGYLTDAQRTSLLSLEPLSITSTVGSGNAFFDATGVSVYTDRTTSVGTDFLTLKTQQAYGSTFSCGWYRRLDLAGERILDKPSVLGGIVLAPSFLPNQDICGFGGDSYLYALYFETGTAYYQSVIGTEDVTVGGETKQRVLHRKALGPGHASSLGIHVGRERGARGFVQQSTGTITQIDLTPAFDVKSGFTNWREVR
jgi:type IV pilus assembly protein PilY1